MRFRLVICPTAVQIQCAATSQSVSWDFPGLSPMQGKRQPQPFYFCSHIALDLSYFLCEHSP